jgi:hypothetical protein
VCILDSLIRHIDFYILLDAIVMTTGDFWASVDCLNIFEGSHTKMAISILYITQNNKIDLPTH